jgi:hypothetical protein
VAQTYGQLQDSPVVKLSAALVSRYCLLFKWNMTCFVGLYFPFDIE